MSERETAQKAVRLKAIKLLEALAERCERPEDEDHDWHTCRSCVAAFSLTQPGEKSLLRLLLDELMAAGADPVPVCQWREIATAPKDRWILLWGSGWRDGGKPAKVPCLAIWSGYSRCFETWDHEVVKPTHWCDYTPVPLVLRPAEESQ